MNPAAPDRRILVAELDSVANRRLYVDDNKRAADVDEQLIGALRIALMLSGQILLTDSMLFDSQFFTRIDPPTLAHLLGVPPHRIPLTVLHFEDSLRASLDAKLARGPRFRWQLAGPHQPSDWATDDIKAGWDRWIRAAELGHVQCEPMLTWEDKTPKPKFELRGGLTSPSASPHVKAMLEAATENDRSAVFSAYDAGHAAGLDDATMNELRRLRSAFNTQYFDAMATQHEAEWVSVTDRGQHAAQAPGREMFRLSGALVELAQKAPPAVYAQIAYATEADRERFYATHKRSCLRAIAFRAHAAVSTPGLRETVLGVSRSLLFAALAIVIAWPNLSSNATWLPWAIFGVSIVTAVPWDALFTFWSMRPTKLDAALSVGRQ